jgi:purine-cytosine permease-like protein
MSNPEQTQPADVADIGEAPRLEPWLIVMLLAIVPMLVAVVSRDLVMHLGAISVILFVAAIGMLVVQERRSRQ